MIVITNLKNLVSQVVADDVDVTQITTNANSITTLETSKINTTAIGVSVQPYNANTVVDASYVHTDNNYTTTEKNKLSAFAIESLNMTSKIGNPTHIDDFKEVFNHIHSSGITSGCDITDNLDGTISTTVGTGFVREPGDDGHGIIHPAEIPAGNSIALTNNAINYVYASYNDGVTIALGVTQTSTDINLIDIIPICIVTREGNSLHIIDVRSQNVNHIARAQIKDFYTNPFTRKNGGAIIANAGTRHIQCTAGVFYFQLDELPLPSLNTTGADTLEEYKHVDGGWVESDISQLSNLYYDNGTNLVALGNNKFGVHWIYGVLGTNAHYASVYGTQEYANLESAKASSAPSSLPISIQGVGVLLGRTIFEKGAAEFTVVETAFQTTFSSTSATIHNGLAGLQGGAVNEYYHMTSAQHTDLFTIVEIL